jgi:hypothetical protein
LVDSSKLILFLFLKFTFDNSISSVDVDVCNFNWEFLVGHESFPGVFPATELGEGNYFPFFYYSF